MPQWGSCFSNNDLSEDSQAYMNFHGTQGLELVLAAAEQDPSIISPEGLLSVLEGLTGIAADTDISEHDCQTRFGELLPSLPRVTIPPFEPSGAIDPAPSDEYIEALCGQIPETGQVNREALDVDCPRLDQYNLFADPADPRSLPHDGGLPYVLNTKLFSDYSSKYRVAFIPPGTQAVYADGQDGSNPNGALEFPQGTVLAKTFAFTDESKGTEELVETRLLIKRQSKSGKDFWDGLVYIWETGSDGQPVALLSPGGGSRTVSWHYQDTVSGKLLTGSTDQYAMPP